MSLPVAEYDAAVMARWPGIRWREPIPIQRGVKGWGCRLCIGRLGLKPGDPLFETQAQAAQHLLEVHGLPAVVRA